jgi:hypothetical protein
MMIKGGLFADAPVTIGYRGYESSEWVAMFPLKVAENEEPQLQNKRGRLTTLRDSSEAENGEPQLQNKRGIYLFLEVLAMRKLLSIALVLAMVFSFTVIAMAAEGVVLRKTADKWYIDVTNGYTGIVTYKDNKKTYTKEVNGNGNYFVGEQSAFTGPLTLVGTYGSDTPEEPTIIGTRTITTTTFDGYVAVNADMILQIFAD